MYTDIRDAKTILHDDMMVRFYLKAMIRMDLDEYKNLISQGEQKALTIIQEGIGIALQNYKKGFLLDKDEG